MPMSLSILSSRLSGNFTPGRAAQHPVDLIVIHVSEGDASSVVSWFNNPAAKVSAHYLVRSDGKILQFVDEDDTAWHAGRVYRPSARLVLGRAPSNPNVYSIGIEHEGDGTHELTDAQRAASVALIADICRRRHIPVDRDHIIGHREIFIGKTCPGAIDVSRLVAAAKEAGAPPAPQHANDYPRAVWSPYLNDWLIVTQFISDNEWYYRSGSELALVKGIRAATPLSRMPLRPPV